MPTIATEQQVLQHDQASLMLRLETQQMYSRKQTLLLTGPAIYPPTRGEDIRGIAIELLVRHLGLSGIQPKDICACHRLKNPKVILVRFVHMDHSDMVYRARTKPKQRGLLIFESLTSERLSVINMIKDLKSGRNSNIISYYTQSGKIFVRTSEDKGEKPIEIPFGLDQEQIRMMCEGRKVDPSPTTVRDQFRTAHSHSSTIPVSQVARSDSSANPWIPVLSKRAKRATNANADMSSRASNSTRQVSDDPAAPTDTMTAVSSHRDMVPSSTTTTDRSMPDQSKAAYAETSVKQIV